MLVILKQETFLPCCCSRDLLFITKSQQLFSQEGLISAGLSRSDIGAWLNNDSVVVNQPLGSPSEKAP